jgi:hypothetical protein
MEEPTGETASSAIPNSPEGTATVEEYQKDVVAVDGPSLLLLGKEWQKLEPPCKEQRDIPVGFKLMRHRASKSTDAPEQAHDYAAQHQARLE